MCLVYKNYFSTLEKKECRSSSLVSSHRGSRKERGCEIKTKLQAIKQCKKQPNRTNHHIEPATALATGAPWIVMELIGGATNEVSPGHELIGR